MKHLTLNLGATGWSATPVDQAVVTALKGQTYLDQRPIAVHELNIELSKCATSDQLAAFLQRLNGFYAWVEQTATQVRAAVDHIRSRPLFYGMREGHLYLSDDAEWVRQQVGDQEMDPIAREEFLLAGYVTGPDTLFANVKQLQAGELLIARQTTTGLEVKTQRYYRFLHQEPREIDEPNLRARLELVTVRAMQRLIEYANGRQIVIPLSGGYDSRLIATMLKKLGYTNVLCFTYGVHGNREAQYSKQVAESLGFSWIFVEYTKNLWRKEWATPEAKTYRKMASGHVSLPHIQDWLAVKNLVNEKLVNENAIFVPGHSGDFVAGSHIPKIVFEKQQHTFESVISVLIKDHLSNCPKNQMQISEKTQLAERVVNRISLPFDGTAISFANLYECWDCQERQAKYIVNSIRVYEQFKHEWWMPQWDLEFVRFWETVPLSLRRKRIWFKEWIQEKYAEESGDNFSRQLQNASENVLPSLGLRIAKKLMHILPKFMVEVVRRSRNRQLYANHFLAFDGLMSDDQLHEYVSLNYNIIGMYSDAYIKSKW